MSFFSRWSCLLLIVQSVFAATAPKTRPTRPNVLLITLDTTRADRMGFLGSDRGLTPNLDDLARQSVVFPRAYSHVPLTTASHATILTGTYPQFNHVSDFRMSVGKDLPFLPSILHDHGYKTAAFVASLVLDPKAGAPGFERGFDTYDARFRTRRPGDDRYQTLERRADDVVAQATAWLNQHPAGSFFLWVHLYDAHAPYDPPEPFKTRYASDPYGGEIAYEDAAVGKLLADLRAKGRYQNTVIAVMADHGEAFGEHGEQMHGVFLYDETIHIPLLFKMPKAQFAGKRVGSRAVLVDVLPTILAAVGIAVPKPVQGESLLPAMKADSELADRPAYAETDYPHHAFAWSSLRSLRTGKYLFVEAPKKELYDQSVDRKAEHNMAAEARAVTDTLTGQLDNFRRKTSSASTASKAEINPEAEQALSALGYVTSSDSTSAPGSELQGADPKDRIELSNNLYEALLDVEDARYQHAVPLLERIIAQQPNIHASYLALGTCWTWLHEYDKAIPALRKALELRDGSALTHYQLALALSRTGDWEGALPEYEAAIARSPRWAELHFSLAAAYAQVGRKADARKELESTLQLEPKNFRANLVLGRLLTLQGDPRAGLVYLNKAVSLDSKSPDAHLFLADAYAKLGQQAAATRERAKAERLRDSAQP